MAYGVCQHIGEGVVKERGVCQNLAWSKVELHVDSLCAHSPFQGHKTVLDQIRDLQHFVYGLYRTRLKTRQAQDLVYRLRHAVGLAYDGLRSLFAAHHAVACALRKAANRRERRLEVVRHVFVKPLLCLSRHIDALAGKIARRTRQKGADHANCAKRQVHRGNERLLRSNVDVGDVVARPLVPIV